MILPLMSRIARASPRWLSIFRSMEEADRQDELSEAAKALFRSLVRAALSWNVDPATATHNPVFMRDGALNYLSHNSAGQETHAFLQETGVLEPGFNGAYRLTVALDEIDFAADAAFAKGIDTDRIVEILVGLLFDIYRSFKWVSEPVLSIKISPPYSTSLYFPDEAEEIGLVMQNLQTLGYVANQKDRNLKTFQWTKSALPMLKRLYMISDDQYRFMMSSDLR